MNPAENDTPLPPMGPPDKVLSVTVSVSTRLPEAPPPVVTEVLAVPGLLTLDPSAKATPLEEPPRAAPRRIGSGGVRGRGCEPHGIETGGLAVSGRRSVRIASCHAIELSIGQCNWLTGVGSPRRAQQCTCCDER